jgi:hypothetical protein
MNFKAAIFCALTIGMFTASVSSAHADWVNIIQEPVQDEWYKQSFGDSELALGVHNATVNAYWIQGGSDIIVAALCSSGEWVYGDSGTSSNVTCGACNPGDTSGTCPSYFTAANVFNWQ